MADTNFTNLVLSLLLKRIIIPTEFHSQAIAVQEMLRNDVSGLIDSLTDFAVESAAVDFGVESQNEGLNQILDQWLDEINMGYLGQIPTGIKPLAIEYFKERWKGASFPILKITKWGNIKGILVPVKMNFVDGGSIYAKDLSPKDDNLKLNNYDYYLGKEKNEKLDKNVLISKIGCRWFEKYPVPYLIRRGTYQNYKIIESLKNKQAEILDQIIPYMMLIQRGSEGLAREGFKIYTDDELKAVKEQFQDLMDKLDTSYISDDNKTKKTPMRVTQFDEKISHLIPDLSTIFNQNLFLEAERNILSGLGFIDTVQSGTRQEAYLNPKIFIEEVKAGVKDFKQILKDITLLIKKENINNKKYFSNTNIVSITSSPVRGFMTDQFKQVVRQLWSNGRLSDQTAVELIAEVDFDTEVYRKKRETAKGLEEVFYPPLTQNIEDKSIDTRPATEDVNGNPISPTKIDKTTKQEYDYSKYELVGSPYNKVSDLPIGVKNHMRIDLQRIFMSVFNDIYNRYGNEQKAFRIAWSVIKKIATKKKNIWVRKSQKVKGSLELMEANEEIIIESTKEVENEIIEESNKHEEREINNG